MPDYYKELVPQIETHTFFPSIYNRYKALSNGLYKFFHMSSTISVKAIKVKQTCNEVQSSTDGFMYLTYILHKNLPQFGFVPVQINKELAKLFIIQGETLLEYHIRAVALQHNLHLSHVRMNKTIFIQTYLDNLSSVPSQVSFPAYFNRRFRCHLRINGDNIDFVDSITDIPSRVLLRHTTHPDTTVPTEMLDRKLSWRKLIFTTKLMTLYLKT